VNFERNWGRKTPWHILMNYSDIRAETMISQNVVGAPLLTHSALFALTRPTPKNQYSLKIIDISENK